METRKVNIDFAVMQKAIKENVRAKAKSHGSLIIYTKSGELIEENPNTNTTRSVKKEHHL